MKKYYIHNGAEQEGPFALEDLRSKKISKTTPIWHEGLPDWTAAGQVEELAVLFTTPPPFKDKSTPPPFENQKNTTTQTEQKKPEPRQSATQSVPVQPKKKSIAGKLIVYGLVIGLLVIGTVYILNSLENGNGSDYFDGSSGDSYEEKVMTVEEEEQANPLRFLSSTGTYQPNFWGDELKIECEITNNATVAVYKDARIKFTYYSKSGTALDNHYETIYEKFKPGVTKTLNFRIPNHENMHEVGWEIVSAEAM